MQDQPHKTSISGTWFITFTDIVSLMLTFFVMLYAMSSVKTEKWSEIRAALSLQSEQTETPEANQPTARHNIATVFRKRAINLDYLHAVLQGTLKAEPRFKTARLTLLEDRLVVSLPGAILFTPASAVLRPEAETAVFALGGLLSNITNPVAVVAHADPRPPAGDAYASNWELTIGRAASVANALKRTGYTRDVAVLGAGSAQYDGLAELTPAERDTLSRRVDIMILSGGG